ncbi:MAG: hypothetical protein HY006_01790 [Candidatus Sungbacteria bacterium]|nr:hypothetical protein [Candidatus Sungbacteria bacterium]
MEPVLLVVTDSSQMGDRVRGIVSALGIDTVFTACHQDALRMFLDLQPTHVLVTRYAEPMEKGETPIEGFRTWQALQPHKGKARLTRCGFHRYPHADYFLLPLAVDKLQTVLFPGTQPLMTT